MAEQTNSTPIAVISNSAGGMYSLDNSYTAGEEMSVGDLLTIKSVPVRRKWWQLWKPREWREDRLFRVTSAHGGADV